MNVNLDRCAPSARFRSIAAAWALVLLFLCAPAQSRGAAIDLPHGDDLPAAVTSARPPSFADIAARAMPAVVNIVATQTPGSPRLRDPFTEQDDPLEQFLEPFFGEFPPVEGQSLGSGFIIAADGYIVTTHHVIGHAQEITVRLAQERRETYPAKVIGIDELTDLALIKISAARPLPVIPLGSSADLRIGDWLIAIGNPFGLDRTVTAGIVSGKGRVIGAGPYDDFIQTDASINPGNSGGPLLNARGEVVGVNSTILSRAGADIGIGFAIPVDVVKSVIGDLKIKGKVSRGWLGVTLQPVTPDLAFLFRLKEAGGVLIAEVSKGGPAEVAGIRRGDVIIAVNRTPVREFNQLPAIVARIPAGGRAEIVVMRDAREQTFTVTVGEQPGAVPVRAVKETVEECWGMTLADVSPGIIRRFRLEAGQEGVVVIGVERDGWAAQAGIRPGDVIEEVDRRPIRSLDEFAIAAAEAGDSDRILILSRRGGTSLFRVLRPDG